MSMLSKKERKKQDEQRFLLIERIVSLNSRTPYGQGQKIALWLRAEGTARQSGGHPVYPLVILDFLTGYIVDSIEIPNLVPEDLFCQMRESIKGRAFHKAALLALSVRFNPWLKSIVIGSCFQKLPEQKVNYRKGILDKLIRLAELGDMRDFSDPFFNDLPDRRDEWLKEYLYDSVILLLLKVDRAYFITPYYLSETGGKIMSDQLVDPSVPIPDREEALDIQPEGKLKGFELEQPILTTEKTFSKR